MEIPVLEWAEDIKVIDPIQMNPIMCHTAEQPERGEAGSLKIVGADSDIIYKIFKKFLTDKNA